jgi:CRP-like cAMP-binding protein
VWDGAASRQRITRWPARAGDPAGSQEAAVEMVASGKMRQQQSIALEAVRSHPGCTSFEMTAYCALDRYQLARRLPELERQGLVRRGRERICRISGRLAAPWSLADGHRTSDGFDLTSAEVLELDTPD